MFEKFQCLLCHQSLEAAAKVGKGAADLAPDLVLAKDRLKSEWIAQWLRNPGEMQPGTNMPNYFYYVSPDAISPLLCGASSSSTEDNPINSAVPIVGRGSASPSSTVPCRFARFLAAFSARFNSRWRLRMDMRDLLAMNHLFAIGFDGAVAARRARTRPRANQTGESLHETEGNAPVAR